MSKYVSSEYKQLLDSYDNMPISDVLSANATTLQRVLNWSKMTIRKLDAIVDKLPKCWRLDDDGELVQDEPIVPNMKLFGIFEDEVIPYGECDPIGNDSFGDAEGWQISADKAYATEEAAKTAMENKSKSLRNE